MAHNLKQINYDFNGIVYKIIEEDEIHNKIIGKYLKFKTV